MYSSVNILYNIFLFAAFFQLILGIMSLRSGFRFHKYVVSRLKSPSEKFHGLVSVIVPCRGIEPGLERNLNAVLGQERGGFEAIFVVDSIDDPAVPIIEKVIAPFDTARLIVSGEARTSGQKVHNLIKAVKSVDQDSKALVFADSDACPPRDWLENILSPLNSSVTGCSSGYRWFVQKRGGVATHLRSAWNASIASALGPDTRSNFCWGGSAAIKTSVFNELDILKHWDGTLSDDFVLSNRIKDSDYEIHFEPKCLTPTVEDCSIGELFEFTTRQMKITKTYSGGHFKISLFGSAFFTLTAFLGILALFCTSGTSFLVSAGLLGLIWFLGTSRAILRVNTVLRCIRDHSPAIQKQYIFHALLWPFSTFLFLINDIAAIFSRKITWRGITYELVSESEIRIIN